MTKTRDERIEANKEANKEIVTGSPSATIAVPSEGRSFKILRRAMLFGGIVFTGLLSWFNSLSILQAYQTSINIGVIAFIIILLGGAFIWELIIVGKDVNRALAQNAIAQQQIEELVQMQVTQLEALENNFAVLKPLLISATAEIRQNAEFIHNGFIGLQNKAIEVERIPVESALVRYSIHGHLPSHVRTKKLTTEMAKSLYKGWTPERLVDKYTDLINKRWEAHSEFLNRNGECWELYTLAGLEKYAEGGTDFDKIIDAADERKTRFERLKELNQMENYHLRIFDRSLGSSLLLRVSNMEERRSSEDRGALLIDLRLPDSTTDFQESCYGIFSHSQSVCHAYRKKVDTIMAQSTDVVISDRKQLEQMINGWIAKIK